MLKPGFPHFYAVRERRESDSWTTILTGNEHIPIMNQIAVGFYSPEISADYRERYASVLGDRNEKFHCIWSLA